MPSKTLPSGYAYACPKCDSPLTPHEGPWQVLHCFPCQESVDLWTDPVPPIIEVPPPPPPDEESILLTWLAEAAIDVQKAHALLRQGNEDEAREHLARARALINCTDNMILGRQARPRGR